LRSSRRTIGGRGCPRRGAEILALFALLGIGPQAATAEPTGTQFADPTSTASLTVFQPDPLATLAESLKKKEKALAERELALKKKEEYLESVRKETAGNLAKIQALYDKLEKQAAAAALAEQQRQKNQAQRDKELSKWRNIYSSMPPEKAGPIIQGLETDFALELLSQMEPKKAAKILSAIQPEKAVELGKKLAVKKP
jgi:flagellar motility protein MotE (MotC chaperone)